MPLAKVISIIGLALILAGIFFIFFPITQEVWNSYSRELRSGTATVSYLLNHPITISYPFLKPPEDIKNLLVNISLRESEGRPFSYKLTNGRVYSEGSGRSSYDFTITLSSNELEKGLTLMLMNKDATRIVEEDFMIGTMAIYGIIKYSTYLIPEAFAGLPLKSDVRVTGVATSSKIFNIYFVNNINLEKWLAKLPFDAYYRGEGGKSYRIDFTIPLEDAKKYIFYCIAIVGEDVRFDETIPVEVNTKCSYTAPVNSINIYYSVKASWNERTYIHILGGIVMGILLGGVGFLLLIAALVIRIVWKK